MLNHISWVIGCALGAIAGSNFNFKPQGLEFCLTALFIVASIDQWKTIKNKLPMVIAFVSAILVLVVLGSKNMILIAIVISIIATLFFKKRL